MAQNGSPARHAMRASSKILRSRFCPRRGMLYGRGGAHRDGAQRTAEVTDRPGHRAGTDRPPEPAGPHGRETEGQRGALEKTRLLTCGDLRPEVTRRRCCAPSAALPSVAAGNTSRLGRYCTAAAFPATATIGRPNGIAISGHFGPAGSTPGGLVRSAHGLWGIPSYLTAGGQAGQRLEGWEEMASMREIIGMNKATMT